MTDPRDIERIHPPAQPTDSNVTMPTDDGTAGRDGTIQGAVVKESPTPPADRQVFPGKGRGENKKAGA